MTSKQQNLCPYYVMHEVVLQIEISRAGEITENLIWYARKIEPHHDKTNKITCVPSEDSDQPGHLPSLISLCYVL